MKFHIFLTAILIAYNLFFSATATPKERLSDYVNPFIGASTNEGSGRTFISTGKTFPGATVPWGMTQVSPNTITGGDNGSGYSDEHRTIEGFALTQMSGVGWYGDLGNFLVMPTTGALHTYRGTEENPDSGYRSRYDKESEKASAGYYSVHLTDYDITTELTATPHCGIMRFTFPENEHSRIQIDLARRVGGTSTQQYIEKVDDYTIRGWMRCTPDGGGWGNGGGNGDYTVYFYAQFNRSIENYGIWSADIPEDWSRKLEDISKPEYIDRIIHAEVIKNPGPTEGAHLGFFTEFPTYSGEQVILKTGISFVNMAGAEANLKGEVRGWNFDKYRIQAADAWEKVLGKIRVFGGSKEQKTIFYTALYHTMIDPRSFCDIDGQYLGGDKLPHQSKNFTKRTIFSGWDVFRSQFPLQTLINPDVVNDMINSLLSLAEENGSECFNRWEFLNAYSGCMVGNPAISIIADAWEKNIRNYDIEKAYTFCVHTADQIGHHPETGYTTEGYPISETLEYAYSDWCVSVLAKALGKTEDMEKYKTRGQSYRLIFDHDEFHWFRPRQSDGSWAPLPEQGRQQQWYGCIESNPYQQGWFVPHDIPGMVELMGGKEKTLTDLIEFFKKTPDSFIWNEFYNHSNEPVHHIPFLFNRLSAPWLTQYWTRFICNKAYKNEVQGLCGNEDVGQMSAWYVLTAMGFHPICPGDSRYELTTPLFDRIEIQLDSKYASGKKFVITVSNNQPENNYIQSATLNGHSYKKCYLRHEDIVQGGTLHFELDSQPNKLWGITD